MEATTIRPQDCYRLPWTLTDNVLGWLEPTKRCNLKCDGCYSRNEPDSDKSVAQIRADLDVFVASRRMDSISITGGEPLLHPEIVEIVRMIRHDYGLKPVINSNGKALTPKLLRELIAAGVFGFTFHVDSSQHRPGWEGADEIALNDLRLELARRVTEAGNVSVAFNATIFADTLHHVPGLLKWAARHVDIVNSMVFILFRTMRSAEFDYLAQGRPVVPDDLVYLDQDRNPRPLTAQEVISVIREEDPSFRPAGYLGGTHDPDSFKWLIAGRFGDGERIHGYMGPRSMEAAQVGHHLLSGRYVAYSHPRLMRAGRGMMLLGATVDDDARRAARTWIRSVLRSPRRLARTVHLQTVAIIQPIDMAADGTANMCDGCPDMTVHNGELVWSCRLEERLRFGAFLTPVPRRKEQNVQVDGYDPAAGDAQRTTATGTDGDGAAILSSRAV